MKNWKHILHTLAGAALVAVALFLIFSSARSDTDRRCQNVLVHIKDEGRQLLVKQEDVIRSATNAGQEPLIGQRLIDTDLKSLERRVESSGMIRECQAYFDLQGNLHLDVEVYKPVARILGNPRFPDRYMDQHGHFFPVSKNFTPTVLLLSGEFFADKTGLKSKDNQDLLELINTIITDEFWRAQITRMDIDKKKEVRMEPLLGNNIIAFGRPEKIATKLEKLMIFYQKILPQEQWSTFQEVSVKFDGQIVCK